MLECLQLRREIMRTAALVLMFLVSVSTPAIAQEWTEFVDRDNGFKLDFPGTPKITDTTWLSQMKYTLPARVYSVDKGGEHYSMTVLDYRPIGQQDSGGPTTVQPRQ